MSKQIVTVGQILVSVALIAVILLQAQGKGLGQAWSGGPSYHSKRGMEKILLVATVVFGLLFLMLSILNILFG